MSILDMGANVIAAYWDGTEFDGYPLVHIPVSSKSPPRNFQTADDIIAFISATIRDLRAGNHKQIFDDFKIMAKHVDRRSNEITIRKCQYFNNHPCESCQKSLLFQRMC